jgi:predicted transcriptional regulator
LSLPPEHADDASRLQQPRKRRSKFEIHAAILQAVYDGYMGPTAIMYRSNQSWAELSKELNHLLHKELLVKTSLDKRVIYNLTESGRDALREYQKVLKQLETNSTIK